jgi:hypothetical protein
MDPSARKNPNPEKKPAKGADNMFNLDIDMRNETVKIRNYFDNQNKSRITS